MSELEKIERFIKEHHVFTLATAVENTPWCCSVFYAYDTHTHIFVFASDTKTKHIQHIMINPNVAAAIHLRTKTVGKIQGLQIAGVAESCKEERLKKLYFDTFPYASAMRPQLWLLKPTLFKYTDNRLGFGKKLEVTLPFGEK